MITTLQSSMFKVQGSRFKVSADHHLSSPFFNPFNPLRRGAFTLLELLVVIAIVGLIAGIAMPVIGKFKPNFTASAISQLVTDIGRARQLAISQHTTVYMVFVPTNFWADPAYNVLPATEKAKANQLLDKQMIGYNYVSIRSLGDQPGRPTVRYLSEWKTLPEGAFIGLPKWRPNNQELDIFTNTPSLTSVLAFRVFGFNKTSWVPFPSADAAPYKYNSIRQPYVTVPYIAFDYQGRVVAFDSMNRPVQAVNELIPLSKGSVSFSRDPVTKTARTALPSFTEQPVGSITNSYNLVYIDWLTGRARAIQQEVQ